MFNHLLKISKSGTGKVIIVAVAGIVLVIFTFLLVEHQADMRSERNIAIKREAIKQNDISICNQIEGGIKATTPSKKLQWGEVLGSPRLGMTEEETKASCISDVKRAYELRKSY